MNITSNNNNNNNSSSSLRKCVCCGLSSVQIRHQKHLHCVPHHSQQGKRTDLEEEDVQVEGVQCLVYLDDSEPKSDKEDLLSYNGLGEYGILAADLMTCEGGVIGRRSYVCTVVKNLCFVVNFLQLTKCRYLTNSVIFINQPLAITTKKQSPHLPRQR